MKVIRIKGKLVGSLQIFQAMNQALEIMEADGEQRDNIDLEVFAATFLEVIHEDCFFGSETPEDV